MNKVSLYTLLILLFLGLSKSFSKVAQQSIFLQNELVFSGLFPGAPMSLILIDAFKAGFFIKTYYLKFKIVHGFKQSEYIVVRTNEKFWKKHKENIGMSLFRRHERDSKESTVPLPPGSLYIGDPAFGNWRYRNSGKKYWVFHRVYRHFTKQFYWGEFRPDFEFYNQIQIHEKTLTPYYGPEHEFGTNGELTKRLYESSPYRTKDHKETFFIHMNKFIKIPSWQTT